MIKNQNFYKKLAVEAAKVADSKKAENITIYDAGTKSTLFYYVLIVTAASAPQISAIEQEILVQLKKDGAFSLHKDGMQSKNWKVVGYGGLVVHIFETQTREFYSLDKIYADCKRIDWKPKEAKKPAVKNPAAKTKKTPPKKKAAGTEKKTPKKDRRRKTK